MFRDGILGSFPVAFWGVRAIFGSFLRQHFGAFWSILCGVSEKLFRVFLGVAFWDVLGHIRVFGGGFGALGVVWGISGWHFGVLRCLGAFWGASRWHLGAFWGISGHFGALGRLEAFWSVSEGDFETFLVVPDSVLGCFRAC